MGIVSRLRLPQLIPLNSLHHFSAFCPYLKLVQNASNEPLTSHGYALAPFRLSRLAISANGLVDPLPVALSKLGVGSEATTGNQHFSIDQGVSLRRILDLVVTAMMPGRRMLHYTVSDHVQIDVDQTTEEMLTRLYRSGVIPVFPERPFSLFPAVIFLCRFSRNQLHALRDYLIFSVYNEQVDVVGRDGVVENIQTKALFRLEQPLKPALPIPRKFEKELLLMASVGDVPDLPRNMMTIGACHRIFLNVAVFDRKWAL
jgi:hypothetical protein